MIPLVRPIKHIHVSGFNGSRSLCSRGISHASHYRLLQDRLQVPSWNPYCIPQESPGMVSSAYLCGSVSTTSLPLSSVVPSSSPSVGPFPPPLHRLHRTTLLLDTRAASAPFFAPARRIRSFLCLPPSPPSAHHASRAAFTYFFYPPCVPHPSPLPQPAPKLCVSVLTKIRGFATWSLPWGTNWYYQLQSSGMCGWGFSLSHTLQRPPDDRDPMDTN